MDRCDAINTFEQMEVEYLYWNAHNVHMFTKEKITCSLKLPKAPADTKHEFEDDLLQRTISEMSDIIGCMPMPGDPTKDLVLPPGLVPLYDHQRYGLSWLCWREREFPGGGILADEMGLGKTIMIIALIMKSKNYDLSQPATNDQEKTQRCIPSQATLVVCPVGCIPLWNNEINSKGKGLCVYTFHGPKRTKSAADLAKYDVVVTTYQTIVSDIKKDDAKSPMLQIYWKRIVLDEAHSIRNPQTVSARSICKIAARYRWAVTGTPIHNRPEDFFSIVKFLRLTPFDDPKVWDFWIGLKQVKKLPNVQQLLHTLGNSLILRRTKQDVQEAGGNVKAIPPKTIEVVNVEPNEAERQVYDCLRTYAKDKFSSPNTKFLHIFALLMRLRQCAVLPHLITTMFEDKETNEELSFGNDDGILSKTNPIFDRFYQSSKFKRIIEDVELLRKLANNEGRPMEKIVIVSLWTTTLDILYQHFSARHFSCVSITGKDDFSVRAENMEKFNNYPEKYHICLLSLMAGGVGLNLTGGNHVFFVEPHWNPQLELQAQDRVHRFGQNKKVFIKRYIATGTVEDRIMDLQSSKLELADGVLNSARRTAGFGLSRTQLRMIFE